MTREIKFRTWDKLSEQMMDVAYINFSSKIVWVFNKKKNESYPLEFKDCELLQHTGLEDTTENEIYESDVVEDEYGRTNLVRFKEGLFLIGNWNAHGFMNAFTEFKVIGNVYANPELLEETK